MCIRKTAAVIALICTFILIEGCNSPDDSKQDNEYGASGLNSAIETSIPESGSPIAPVLKSDIGDLSLVYSLKDIIQVIPNNMTAGIIFDKLQNLYVATYGIKEFEAWVTGKKPMYKIKPDGSVSIFAEIECGLMGPLAVDSKNNLFISVSYSKGGLTDIIKVTPDGTKTIFASGFKQPCSGIFDSSGNMYLTDALEHKIFTITPQGDKSVFLDLASSDLTAGLLYHGLAVGSDFETMYLAGYAPGTGNVLKCKINKDGTTEPLEKVCDLPSPRSIWVDRDRVAFVTCGESSIARIMPDGTTRIFSDKDIQYSGMINDFSGTMYIIGKDLQIFRCEKAE